MLIYSHSRLATYENCPQQYKLRYVDRIRLPEGSEEGIEAFLGSRVHDALEKLHKEFLLTRTNAQLKDLQKEVLSRIKTIEKDTKFVSIESNLCDWCEFPEFCPAKKHEYKVQTLHMGRCIGIEYGEACTYFKNIDCRQRCRIPANLRTY